MSPKSKKRNVKAKNTRNENGASPEFREMMGLFETVQEYEAEHQQCVRDALEIYKQISHDDFMEIILFGIRKWMGVQSFDNPYSQTGLRFLARLAVSNFETNPDNKIVKSITKHLVDHTSARFVTRQFLCYLIYYVVRYANILNVPIDSDALVEYTLMCAHDPSAAVRDQAIAVLLLFQEREDVVDELLQHLSMDPSRTVRCRVIKSIKFTDKTESHILERLQDLDEMIRISLYTDLLERDVRTLSIQQRCQILHCASDDSSGKVQRFVTDKLLLNWLQQYKNCYLSLLAAIKLDANEEDIQLFIRLSRYVLFNLFAKFTEDGHIERLCEQLGLVVDGEFKNCVPFDRLSLEMLVFWRLLIQFGRESKDDSIEPIMCDVDAFCKFIQAFVDRMHPENWQQNGFKIQILIEILSELDVDEYGKKSLNDFVANTLLNQTELLNEASIASLVKCAAKSNRNDLGQFIGDILYGVCNKIPSIDRRIDELIESVQGDELKLQISQLKSKILDLKEVEIRLADAKDYVRLRGIRHEIKELRMQIVDICRNASTNDHQQDIDMSTCEMSEVEIIKCLQIFYYSCHLINSTRAPPKLALFYGDFIYPHLYAENFDVRAWALKSNASFSMPFRCGLEEAIQACYEQFILNHNEKLWTIAIQAICELVDKHQVDIQVERLIPLPANVHDESIDDRVSIIDFLFDLLKGIKSEEIRNSLIIGLCRLIISGMVNDKQKIAYMLVEFFASEAFTSSKQILAQFFRTLTKLRCQSRLISALIPAFELISSSNEQSNMRDIIQFLVAITLPEQPFTTSFWHNELAIELVKLMLQSYGSQMMNVIGETLNTLQLDVNDDFKQTIKPLLAELLGEALGHTKKVKEFWKKLGFKDADRKTSRSSSVSIASMESTDRTLKRHSESSKSTASPDRRSKRRSISWENSTAINDENAHQPTGKENESQRADTGPTRRAFGNRLNVRA